MAFPTTILGRTWPSVRWALQGLATTGGPARSEQVHCRLTRVSADRPGLMTDRVAAKICRVGPRMIGLWIETGAWPLPHAVGARTLVEMHGGSVQVASDGVGQGSEFSVRLPALVG